MNSDNVEDEKARKLTEEALDNLGEQEQLRLVALFLTIDWYAAQFNKHAGNAEKAAANMFVAGMAVAVGHSEIAHALLDHLPLEVIDGMKERFGERFAIAAKLLGAGEPGPGPER